jgi:hypothetical protein
MFFIAHMAFTEVLKPRKLKRLPKREETRNVCGTLWKTCLNLFCLHTETVSEYWGGVMELQIATHVLLIMR